MIVLFQKGLKKWIELLLFTPDSRSLITSGNDGAFLWKDLPGTNTPQSIPAVQFRRNVRFTLDGKWLMTGGVTGLDIIDMSDLSERAVELERHGSCYFDISPDGRHLLLALGDYPTPRGWISYRPRAKPTLKSALWTREVPHKIEFQPVCVAGARFVLREETSAQGTVRYTTYSLKNGNPLAVVERKEACYHAPFVSPNGQLLVALSNAQLVVLPADDLSKPVTTLKNPGRQYFTGIAFHPSGRYLAATSNDATVKLYDTTSWQVAKTYTWDIGRMRSIAFSPDGTLAAAGSDSGKVVVWDVDV